jgi:hypothetical protein
MFSAGRRNFLRKASGFGAALSAESWFASPWLSAVAPGSGTLARVYVDSRRTVAPLDRNVFGSFLEHLGRAIYQGI